MATGVETNEAFFARAEAIIAHAMVDGTIAAIGRESVKELRDTFHKVFFGEHERGGEIGAPLNPLYGELAEAKEHWQEAMTASEIARDDRPYQPEQENQHQQSHEHGR